MQRHLYLAAALATAVAAPAFAEGAHHAKTKSHMVSETTDASGTTVKTETKAKTDGHGNHTKETKTQTEKR